MTSHCALLSIVYMISFVLVFDRMHFKKKLVNWLKGDNLMTTQELDQIQAIWAACQDN